MMDKTIRKNPICIRNRVGSSGKKKPMPPPVSVSRYLPVPLALVILFFPDVSIRGAASGLSLCASGVIPALFPFLVLSPMLAEALSAWPVFRRAGDMRSRALFSAFIIGMVSGFPIGAVTLTAYCRSHVLDKQTAAAYLGICSASSPAFLSGYVGKALFHSAALGWVLFGIQTLVGCVLFMLSQARKKMPPTAWAVEKADDCSPERGAGFMASAAGALRRGSENMLFLCGTVIFFSVVRSFLCAFLPRIPAAILGGMLEITGGLREIALLCDMHLLSRPVSVIISAGMVGFGGLCVAMQTAAFAKENGIPMGPYFRAKLLSGLICALAAALFMRFSAI
ncbi:MAG: hypothetical protein ACI3XM_09480 [Eubacteriales bacterium]